MKNKNSIVFVLLGCLLILTIESKAHMVLPKNISTEFQKKEKTTGKTSAKKKKQNMGFISADGTDKTHLIKKIVLDGEEIHKDSINKKIDSEKISSVEMAVEGDSLCFYIYTDGDK